MKKLILFVALMAMGCNSPTEPGDDNPYGVYCVMDPAVGYWEEDTCHVYWTPYTGEVRFVAYEIFGVFDGDWSGETYYECITDQSCGYACIVTSEPQEFGYNNPDSLMWQLITDDGVVFEYFMPVIGYY